MSYTGAYRFDDAETYLNKALAVAQEPGAETHSVLGDFMQCLGACYLWKGELQKAEDNLCRALLGRCGENDEYRGALCSVGNVYLKQRRYSEALRMHQEVLERYTKDLGNAHHWVADSCHKIGSIFAVPDFADGSLLEAE
jgi:tetratricopeptide (TPR) repeat protein